MAFATALAGAGSIAGALTARHANGSLIVGGIDLLLGAVSQAVTAFSYTDNTNDQADNLEIEIADPARTWMSTWLPKKGIECTATIKVYNWNLPGDTRTVDCGVFWLDQIDFSGPPNTVSVKATSVPVTTGIKTQKKFRAWEGESLSKIVGQIAEENGLKLVWDAKDDPTLKRADQVDSADLEFVRDKAKDNSLDMRIYNRQLIIYSAEEYDAKPAVYVITYGHANILQFSFSSKLNETYKNATNAFVETESGEEIRRRTSRKSRLRAQAASCNLICRQRLKRLGLEGMVTEAKGEPDIHLTVPKRAVRSSSAMRNRPRMPPARRKPSHIFARKIRKRKNAP